MNFSPRKYRLFRCFQIQIRRPIIWHSLYQCEGGFPVIAETTRNRTFSKEINQVILATMVLTPSFS